MVVFRLASIIFLFIVSSGVQGITTTHHDKPEDTKLPIMATKMKEDEMISKALSPNLTASERHKRLLPYMTFYLAQDFNHHQGQIFNQNGQRYQLASQKPTTTTFQQFHNKFNELTGGNYQTKYVEAAQIQPQPQKIKLTPFLDTNALPGPFIPMRSPAQLTKVTYTPVQQFQTVKLPNYGAIYEKLSQLKLQQQQNQLAQSYNRYNPQYAPQNYIRKPQQVNYIPVREFNNQDFKSPGKTIVETYTSTNIDIPETSYEQPTKTYDSDLQAPHLDHALPTTDEDRKQYIEDQKLNKEIRKQVVRFRQKPTRIVPQKSYKEEHKTFIQDAKPVIIVQRKPNVKNPYYEIPNNYQPVKFQNIPKYEVGPKYETVPEQHFGKFEIEAVSPKYIDIVPKFEVNPQYVTVTPKYDEPQITKYEPENYSPKYVQGPKQNYPNKFAQAPKYQQTFNKYPQQIPAYEDYQTKFVPEDYENKYVPTPKYIENYSAQTPENKYQPVKFSPVDYSEGESQKSVDYPQQETVKHNPKYQTIKFATDYPEQGEAPNKYQAVNYPQIESPKHQQENYPQNENANKYQPGNYGQIENGNPKHQQENYSQNENANKYQPANFPNIENVNPKHQQVNYPQSENPNIKYQTVTYDNANYPQINAGVSNPNYIKYEVSNYHQGETQKPNHKYETNYPENPHINPKFIEKYPKQQTYQATTDHPVGINKVQENPNSLGLILKKLQDMNALPHTLTPDNIDNSIRTLVKILSSLKKQTKFSPIVVAEDSSEYEDDIENEAGVGLGESHGGEPGTISHSYPDHTPEGGTPGKPGVDYPALSTIPKTNFNCKTQRYKGFFGDPDTNCQVWHYCDLNGGQASFLCPNGTIFSQVALTCDWWYNVKCSNTAQLYVLNERLYKYILPLSPKFPEDYSGPLVDRYLALKFKEMEEKMKNERKNNKENSSDEDGDEDEEGEASSESEEKKDESKKDDTRQEDSKEEQHKTIITVTEESVESNTTK